MQDRSTGNIWIWDGGLKTHEIEGGEGDDFEVFSFYVGSEEIIMF